jgi:hypothetical protein
MKLPHRRQFLHLAAGAAALPAVSRIARAQTYPTRPVHDLVYPSSLSLALPLFCACDVESSRHLEKLASNIRLGVPMPGRALIPMMVGSHNELQSETGYIDARSHLPDRRKLLQRTGSRVCRMAAIWQEAVFGEGRASLWL